MKHKYADVIKAWADGAPCQWRQGSDGWRDWAPMPDWLDLRVKPSATTDEQTDNHSGICLEVEA